MTFERPWVLFFALLHRRAERKLALALKALSFAAILIAIAEPVLKTFETKTAVVVLAGTSASISNAGLKAESVNRYGQPASARYSQPQRERPTTA